MRTPKQELEGARAHYQEFETLAQKIGIGKLVRAVPADETEIRSVLSQGDKHLNLIPLFRWDMAAIGTGERARATYGWGRPEDYRALPGNIFYGMGLSLADRVCVLKHVARHHIAKEPSP